MLIPQISRLSTIAPWSRPPGTLLFRPRAKCSRVTVLVVLLLLTAGDIEAIPGPALARPSGRAPLAPSIAFGVLDVRPAAHKAPLIHDVINDYSLDVLALSETWITSDVSPAIKNDAAPAGFNVLHLHREIIPDGKARGEGTRHSQS